MQNEKKNLLVFGYGLGLIISFINYRHWAKHGESWLTIGLIVLAAVLLFITAWDYRRLKSLYTQWMKVGHFIGQVISTIVLSLMFYLIFGIVGIILRVLRKDLLEQKLAPDADSYWIKRDEKEFDQEDYLRQF